ncbi:MAG: hypothetical protein C4581_03095 [Nitrospiraceae bacterium]|nr:MAG: hypothetical protein C4581_03095 [Nitrospiraceae bacterium]
MLKQFYQPWKIKSKSALSAKSRSINASAALNAAISAALTWGNPTARYASLKNRLINPNKADIGD